MQIIITIDWRKLFFSKESKKISVQEEENKRKLPQSLFVKHKFFLPLFFFFLISTTLISVIYTYITTNEGGAANFTDNIVRPVLGNQRTIALEALFFNVDDRINQLKYYLTQSSNSDTAFAESTPSEVSTPSATPAVEFSLKTIPLLSTTTLPEEGVWKPLSSTNGAVLLAKTFVLPDNDRPYAIVNLVKMNMEKLQINIVAGLRQPGGAGKTRTGESTPRYPK